MNMINEFKNRFLKRQSVLYIAIIVIIVGTLLQIFFKIPNVLKVIMAIIVFIAILLTCYSLINSESKIMQKELSLPHEKMRAKIGAYRSMDLVMTISYVAVAVLGAFCGSILIIIIGFMMLLINTVGVFITKKSYLEYLERENQIKHHYESENTSEENNARSEN